MIFIWRGFGYLVPFILAISLWLTSYSFEDTRFGNTMYVGWSLFWAGIFLAFISLFFMSNKQIENPQDNQYGNPVETLEKKHNDFFWLPIWAWGLIFTGISLFFIYGNSPEAPEETTNNIEKNDASTNDLEEEIIEEEVETRPLYLYNCAADSIHIKIIEKNADNNMFDFYVRKASYEYAYVPLGRYTVFLDDYEWDIRVKKLGRSDKTEYDGLWMVLCSEVDLLMVDVTDICKPNMSKDEINAINWMDKVVDKYDGEEMISPKINTGKRDTYRLIGPNVFFPQKYKRNETVYALLRVSTEEKITESLLDEEMNYLYEFKK